MYYNSKKQKKQLKNSNFAEKYSNIFIEKYFHYIL